MTYNFDEIVPRKGTYSIKYDFAAARGMPEDVLPLWVADMDFRSPKEVNEALAKVVEHGIYGYSEAKEDYFPPIRDWFWKFFNFELQRDWLKKTPGVVYALNTAIRALTQKGDKILIQSPVYYPFSSSVINNGRILVDNPLIYQEGVYNIDFEDFEAKIRDLNIKMFLLCSPHNPVGRVWTADDLRRLGEICLKYDCLVVSDEIHCDFVWGNHRHHIFNSLNPEFNKNTILLTAPTKTFNLAGLHISNIFIPNPQLKREFSREIDRTGLSQLTIMGLIANREAYLRGEPWLKELKVYLERNLDFARKFIKERLPRIGFVEPQGTYLLWLDFQNLGLTPSEVNERIIHKAKLWLDEGKIFGKNGIGFQRINFACPRAILEDAFTRLQVVFQDIMP
ncbi:MAG: pyridoxal phosphate-dependent aminotransferase [Deltaproteobacteria bacterium]|jgi:cystathionine beta-lyase|nr:pyridoxal phosphate-dependent aminotransferase [Deltaproteobacteria bacterium]